MIGLVPGQRIVTYGFGPAGPDLLLDLSAEQRGNVTPVHRQLLVDVARGPDATWSERALWACLDRLRTDTWTDTARVQVERAWTDGPGTFCVIYTVTYNPDLRVGIRLRRDDSDAKDNESGSVQNSNDLGELDPEWFGENVADFSIGEPLGTVRANLRTDERGVNWWGSLDAELPTTPT